MADFPPAHHKQHPAVFPEALAERVIRYYSFIGDMVLDPFSGFGTTGRVAGKLGRLFCLIEKAGNTLTFKERTVRLCVITQSFPNLSILGPLHDSAQMGSRLESILP